MFGIGPTELIVILVIALIVVGPERLPTLAGQVGKAIRDFRQMSGDMTGEFQRAFQIDEETPGTNTSVPTDTVLPWATPNGTNDAPLALEAQVIPTEPPTEPVVAASEPVAVTAEQTTVAGEVSNVASNGHHAAPLVATKADPLVDVSFLDDPDDPEETTPVAEESTTTAYESMPVATFGVQPLPADETSAPADTISDAWDAVMTTDATISLPELTAAEIEAATAATAVAVAEPPAMADDAPITFAVQEDSRTQIDPAAEPTIREVIEAQVAAEAFRERRRIATYRRHHK